MPVSSAYYDMCFRRTASLTRCCIKQTAATVLASGSGELASCIGALALELGEVLVHQLLCLVALIECLLPCQVGLPLCLSRICTRNVSSNTP